MDFEEASSPSPLPSFKGNSSMDDDSLFTYRPTTSVYRILFVLALSTLLTCLYAFGTRTLNRCSPKSKRSVQLNWLSRVNSTINASVVLGLALLTLFKDGRELSEYPLHAHSIYLVVGTCCLIAYAIVDSGMVLIMIELSKGENRLENYLYLVHHLITIYLSMMVAVYDYLPFFASIRMLAEFSTPFINLRWFALKSGYKDTLIFRLLQTLTFLAFGSCRLLPIIPFWMWLRDAMSPLQGRRSVLSHVIRSTVAQEETRATAYMKAHFELMVSACVTLDILNCIWGTKLAQLTLSCWRRNKNKSKSY